MSNVRKEKDQYLVAVDLGNIHYDLDGLSIEEACTGLREKAEGYLNVKLHWEKEYGYYGEDDRDVLELKGDRLATEDEIAKYEKELAKDRERNAKERKKEKEKNQKLRIKEDEAALKRAEKAFPERFK